VLGWEIIGRMNQFQHKYGMATVSDLADLLGRTDLVTYLDEQVGWTKTLPNTCVRKNENDEWKLVLPTPDSTRVISTNQVTDGQMSVYFDKENPHWKGIFEYNMMFLRQLENYCNQKLQAQGHLFVNEVFEELGIKKTTEGQKKGWLKVTGNEKVDFHFADNMQSVFDVNGRILLRFDVSEIIEQI
jgi:hypothetical protein